MSRHQHILDQVAQSDAELQAGDGCHPGEAKSLIDYLEGRLSLSAAAKAITAPVLQEPHPPAELYRLWGLLADVMVELPQDLKAVLDLLQAIEKLPVTAGVNWSQLPGFGNMWSDLWQLHTQGPDGWERETLTEERTAELRQQFKAIGTAEAGMYLRGIDGMSEVWAYEAISLVSRKRKGIDVLISEVHAWLGCAGQKLKADADFEKSYTFSRAEGGRFGAQQAVSCTLGEHWKVWKGELLQLSGEASRMSGEGKRLAKGCCDMM